MSNEDLKKKYISRILASQKLANSEREIQNFGAAENIEELITSWKTKFNISDSDLQIASADVLSSEIIYQNNLASTVIFNPFHRVNARIRHRMFWFEAFAEVVADNYFCKSSGRDDGNINIYGYDSDREIASFMLLKLADAAEKVRKEEMAVAYNNVGRAPKKKVFGSGVVEYPKEWMGDEVFIDSYHAGFRAGIGEVWEKSFSHLKSEENLKKKREVEAYFAKEFERSWNAPQESPINKEVFIIGKKVAYNIARKASKNINALSSTRISFTNEDVIYLLIDCSGSMGWTTPRGIDQAREGALEFAKSSQGKRIGIISFANRAKKLLSPQSEIDEKFTNALENLNASGGTNMLEALQLVQHQFSTSRGKRIVVVITDGMPSDEFQTLQVANDLKRAGVEIRAIGCGDAKQEFLDKLVSRAGLGILVGTSRLALTMGEMGRSL